jgi:predicted ArsR family transcriptional regulator
VTLAALVSATGLHHNTVREHLTGLVQRGLVRRTRTEPEGRGRPAWRYESTDEPRSDYASLATALAYGIAESAADAEAIAVRAGERWGRQLIADQGGPVAESPQQARRIVVQLVAALGFAPTHSVEAPQDVLLTRCPLLEVAYRHEAVVCSVHLGIVEGALKATGADPAGTELHPFSDPGGCRLLVPPLTVRDGSTRES